MTVKDLEQLFYLDELIKCEQDRLDELHAALDLHSPGLSDMPKAPGARDKLGDIVPEIVDQSQELKRNIEKFEDEKKRIRQFINHVPNARIRLILILRYEKQQSWQNVADTIGGKETEYSVKHTIYRYLKRSNQ